MGRQKKEVTIFNKGEDYYDNGEYSNAIKCFDEALVRNEKFFKAWFFKGLALIELEEYKDAINCLDKAIEIRPRNSWPWINKGLALNCLGEYEKAIESLDRALSIAPRNDSAWNNKGVALYNLNKFKESIECYDKSIEIFPGESLYHTNRSESFIALNKYEEASKSIDAASKLIEDDNYILYLKGLVFIKKDQKKEAEECYNRLRQQDPDLAKKLRNEGLLKKKQKRKSRNRPDLIETSKHVEIQWTLLQIGREMGLDLWLAKNDRGREYNGSRLGDLPNLIDEIPRQFDDKTNRTIELIDVLWLKGNAIIAAFEIESTTSIYSGLLRMSDLISMQPNLKIPLFIVAPDERRRRVIEEVNRPAFSKLALHMNPICRYISFSSIREHYEKNKDQLFVFKHDKLLDRISESCDLHGLPK